MIEATFEDCAENLTAIPDFPPLNNVCHSRIFIIRDLFICLKFFPQINDSKKRHNKRGLIMLPCKLISQWGLVGEIRDRPTGDKGTHWKGSRGARSYGRRVSKGPWWKMRDEHHRSRQARRTGPLSKQTIPSPRQPPAAQFCFLCSRYVLFLGCSMGLCSLLSLAIGFGMMEQWQSQTCVPQGGRGGAVWVPHRQLTAPAFCSPRGDQN